MVVFVLCRLLRPLNLNNHNMFINIVPAVTSYPLNVFVTYLGYDYIATAVIMDTCLIEISLGTILLIYKGYGFVFVPASFSKVFNKWQYKLFYLSVPQ